MRGLYPIVDIDSLRARGVPPLEFAVRLLEAKPKLLQLRAKSATGRETLTLLRELRELCSASSTWLFANDRADLAALAGCDGVHVGQDDLSVSEVRSIAPALRVGVSTHNLEQLERALAERPDYVAFGPVFATQSKANPDPVVGISGLEQAAERARRAAIPLVAIGGIDLPRARSIGSIGILGAVISALLPPDGDLLRVPELARTLDAALGGD